MERLAFLKHGAGFGLILALLLLIGGCGSKANDPNILLLTLDTLRADALGCYGNEQVQTPNLDRLAQEGTLFEDAICQIPATLASHTAIMTGRLPKTTGVRYRTAQVPATEWTLAKALSERGYDTAAFISSLVLEPSFQLNQGFKEYNLGSMWENGQPAAPERRAEETVSDAIRFLNRERNKPFFLWVHLYDAHTPYDAPEPYKEMYDRNYSGDEQGTLQSITALKTKERSVSHDDLEYLRALYHGEVTYMDVHIGHLLDALHERNELDNTIVVALADHGEALGEKGHFFHGDELYQHSVHIPFIMRYPKAIPANRRVAPLVQTIDVFPTIMDLLDVETTGLVDGQSLLPYLEDEPESPPPSRPGFLETEADPVSPANKLYALRTESHKFIYTSAHRRHEVPLGVFTEIPLKGPTIVMARIKGDASIRLMAHIRYRTQKLYNSRDTAALAKLNTTAVYCETVGSDPLHREAMQQDTFLETPEGWTLQMSPDLYRIAEEYGASRDWPVDYMVIEGVGVDASLPYFQSKGRFWIDQIELYAPSLRFPESPRFRNPFWVIEDFETSPPRRIADAEEGPAHEIETAWTSEDLFGGKRQQMVDIRFTDGIDPNTVDELYSIKDDPDETDNLLVSLHQSEDERNAKHEIANQCRTVLQQWIDSSGQGLMVLELNSSLREALDSLGYTQ